MQQIKQPKLGEPAEQRTDDAGQDAEQGQLQGEQQHGFPAGQAQAAQQRAGVEAAGGEARGGQGNCHACQQHRHQAGHVQVAFRLAQGSADLAVAISGILQALIGRQARLDQLAIGFQGASRAAPEFLVTDPAAGLHHAGGVQVAQVDQYPGCQAIEVAGAIRFVSQYPAQAQGFHPDVDAVADFQVQRGQQSGFDPGFAWLWTAADFFRRVRGRGTFQLTAQRVGVVRGLDTGQLDAIVGGDHTGELHHLRMLQAQFPAALDLFGPCRRAAFQQQVRAEKLRGAQQHRAVETRAEIADGSAGGYRHYQGEEQYPQFSGAGVAQKLANGKAEQAQQRQACHQGSRGATSRPASRRIRRRQRWARRSS